MDEQPAPGAQTVWRRARTEWRFCAVTGLVTAVLFPAVFLIFTIGFHWGPGDPLNIPTTGEIAAVLIWGVLAGVCWLRMIRSGGIACIWALPWVLFGTALVWLLSVFPIFPGLILILLVISGIQVWVAWEAWRLGRAGSGIPD